MLRRVLFIAACVLVTLSLCISAFAVVVPPGRFYSVEIGRFALGLDCFSASIYWIHRARMSIPLVYLALGAGVPGGIYFGNSIGSRLRKQKEARGFPMDEA